jgi:antitoxin component YwqK of YwqJK toxin-antitoxin module
MKFTFMVFILLMFSCNHLFAQDPCTYQTHSKKGSAWVFATYYQPNTEIPLEGVCEQKNGNAPFLYRSFQAGKLKKEVQYSSENKLVSSLEIFDKKRDSVIGEYKNFKEDGVLLYHEIYFLDKNKRRCMHRKSYHINGKPRFDQYFAWIKESELNEYQKPSHPPHTIDDDGYTYLLVPFGVEKSFDETGLLIQERRHQLLVDGTHEFASLHGKAANFHHNGKLKESMTYKSGKLHGSFLEFNFLGDTICKGSYVDGIKNGVWTYWYDNGKLKARHSFNINGNFPFHAQKEEWSENGRLILKFSFDEQGNGLLREWTESGVLFHEQNLVNLSLDQGKEKFWFPNGQLKAFMDHTTNADTVFYERFENGRDKNLKRNYQRAGNKITSIKQWYENGNLKDETLLEKGEFVNTYAQNKYYENGNLSLRDIRKNREQIVEEYAENGIKIRSKTLLDGKIHGRFLELDSTGQIILDIYYKNGLRHGAYRLYKNGVLSYETHYENGVWTPKDDKIKSFMDTYQKLKVSEKQIYTSAAFHALNRFLYTPEAVRKTSKDVDSIAAIIWQLNRVAPHYPDWISNSLVGNQVLRIRLIQTYHGDLKTNNVSSEYSKELLAGLAQLNVKLPDFQFVNGEVYVTIELNEWINMATIKQIFPKSHSFIHVYNPQLEEKSKYRSAVRYTIEQKTVNSWKITIQHNMNTYHVILYGDGTAEIENQALSWADFLKLDLSTLNHFPGWMFED